MRHIDLLRTLALSSALILALGCSGDANEEDAGDTVEAPSVEVAPPAEASEEATDETTPPKKKSDPEASEAEKE